MCLFIWHNVPQIAGVNTDRLGKMQEKTKDKIEAVGGLALETVAYAVPFIGTPLGLVVGKRLAAAEARRMQDQVKQLSQDLADAIEAGTIGFDVLDSDEFAAQFRFVARELLETTEHEKRERLRQALVRGAQKKWQPWAYRYIRIISRLEEPHMEAFSVLRELGGERGNKPVFNGTERVKRHFSALGMQKPEPYYRILFEQLAAEGLVQIDTPSRSAQSSQSGSFLKITKSGLYFWSFLVGRPKVEDESDS